MKKLRILESNEVGHGILIETDAGWVSPKESHNALVIQESAKLDYRNPFEFYAVLQKYDTPNRNGRFYPERILKREAENYKKTISKGLSTSELNHPESSLIDLDRVSHSILETWWDGKILMGKIKLFTSPGWRKMGIVSTRGDQAAMLIMNGATLGISSRGVGSLKNVKGQNIVQEDFELVCFDLVSSPSTPGAYVFADQSEREQYQEAEEKKPQVDDRMKKLMGNLDTFLSK
jgi:hypothetical protein